MHQDALLRSFELICRRAPLEALVASPSRRVTVEEVDALARAAARAVPEEGLEPGAVVGLVAEGPGFLASLLALRRAGVAALLLDAKAPETESLRIAGALGAVAVLRCRTSWPERPGDWGWIATEAGAAPELFLPDAAVVKLTSGSTGLPRGIATSAEELVADDAALSATMGLCPGDRYLAAIPMSHSYGLSSLAIPALARGALLVVPEAGGLPDPFAAAAAAGATFFPTVPAYLDALLRSSAPPAVPLSLRLVITAGAPLSAETSARFREATGLPVHVFYGASECGGICFDREGGAAERGTVGEPVLGVNVVLAGENGPGSACGVVTVRSTAVASSYVPDGDRRLQDGCFIASDLGTFKGGELALLGRTDDLVNIRGKKVNPREVESVLGRFPGVDEVAVFGITLPHRKDQLLRAVVASRSGCVQAEEVRAFCHAHLSAHKVPRSIILVAEMPRNARGKLDRGALLALSPRAAGTVDEHA